jgi:hypothetical protein
MSRSAETLGEIRPAFFCCLPLLNQFLAYHKSRKFLDFWDKSVFPVEV